MTTTTKLPFKGLGSEEAIRALADHVPEAIFTIDLEGKVTFWNRAAERITGWSSADAIGKDCSLLAGDAVNGCSCGVGPLRCGLAETGRTSKRCTVRTRDGRLVAIVKNATPIFSAEGSPVGAIESFVDVGLAQETGPDPGASPVVLPLPGSGDWCGLTGRTAPMLELFRLIQLVARADATVIILGESGTGKERVAEAIHRQSPRAGGPFVRVSCSALNENLLESELFGHVKGAFTGALRTRVGRFEEASGGTLLLDEIGDISPVVQVKLLRVIEQREVERVGESIPRKVDVRLLCATHRDLKALVAEGRFRADLYFRLAVFPLRVPPLREHPEDIEEHVRRVLARTGPGARRVVVPAAMARLRAYDWPGNVRELQNVVEYAALRAAGGDIDVGHLPAEVRGHSPGPAPPPSTPPPEAERDVLARLLERNGWNRAAAARELGVSRVTLWKRLKRLRLEEPG
jgi:PAS domain S-box-containing protein